MKNMFLVHFNDVQFTLHSISLWGQCKLCSYLRYIVWKYLVQYLGEQLIVDLPRDVGPAHFKRHFINIIYSREELINWISRNGFIRNMSKWKFFRRFIDAEQQKSTLFLFFPHLVQVHHLVSTISPPSFLLISSSNRKGYRKSWKAFAAKNPAFNYRYVQSRRWHRSLQWLS